MYSVTDMNAAAYLMVNGFEPLRLDDDPNSRDMLAFVFPDDARSVQGDYWHGGTVIAQDYARAIRRAKRMIINEQTMRRQEAKRRSPAINENPTRM